MNEVRDEHQSTETLSFWCWRERCRLKRGGAFTLAEILITLGIIGVVAALTMPSLIQSYQEKARVTALKKAYSVISNAYKLAINENNNDFEYIDLSLDPENSEWAIKNTDALFNAMKPYLNIIKDCGHEAENNSCITNSACAYNNPSDCLNLASYQGAKRRFTLLAGNISLGFLGAYPTGGIFYVDVNGLKGPNKIGVDIFQFPTDELSIGLYGPDTNNNGTVRCYTNAYVCSGWVILNGNQDYLHCDDLNWNGKTKCK